MLPDYDNFVLGKEVGPVEITLDTERVHGFVYAVDDFDPWYIQNSPFGGPVAPLPLLNSDDSDFAKFVPPSVREDVLAAKYEIRSFAPMHVGEGLLLKTRNVGKYIRRSKGYIVRDFEVLSAADQRVFIRSQLTEMVGIHPAGNAADSGTFQPAPTPHIEPRESGLLPVSRAALGLLPGTPLPTLTKKPGRKQVYVFSARPGWWTSIHTDPDLARSLGFPDAIAQGLMSAGYISQLCKGFFGAAWFTSGWAALAFLRPVCIDDTLRIEGRVTGYAQEAETKTRLHLDVWCKIQHGELTTAGRASAIVNGRSE